MGFRVAPEVDARTCKGAYVRCGCRLFYVLGRDVAGRVCLEDCYLLSIIHVLATKIRDEYELVREAL